MKSVTRVLSALVLFAAINGCTKKSEQAPAPEAAPAEVTNAPAAAPGQDLGNTNAAPADAGGAQAPAGTGH